jgi:hypothetical protein
VTQRRSESKKTKVEVKALKYGIKSCYESEMVAAQPNNQQMRNELFGEGKLVKT